MKDGRCRCGAQFVAVLVDLQNGEERYFCSNMLELLRLAYISNKHHDYPVAVEQPTEPPLQVTHCDHEARAHALWSLLDDIDTLSDATRGNREAFYTRAMQLCERRGLQYESLDGMTLVPSNAKSEPQAARPPVPQGDLSLDCDKEPKTGPQAPSTEAANKVRRR